MLQQDATPLRPAESGIARLAFFLEKAFDLIHRHQLLEIYAPLAKVPEEELGGLWPVLVFTDPLRGAATPLDERQEDVCATLEERLVGTGRLQGAEQIAARCAGGYAVYSYMTLFW